MLLKECKRCGRLIPYGSVYCTECTPIVEANREAIHRESKRKADRDYNKRRDPKYIQFYNSTAWRTLSAKYTQDKGYRCELCGRVATEVHHKKPIQTEQGWILRLDYDNLELLCVDCHNERHERFKRRQQYIKDHAIKRKNSDQDPKEN